MSKSWVILGQLGDRDIEWLAKTGQKHHLSAGQTLIQQGQQIDTLYIIIDGALTLINDQNQTAGQLQSGAIVGELGLFESIYANATLKAANDAVILYIPRERINERLAANPEFAANFYRGMASYLTQHIIENTTQPGHNNLTISAVDTEIELGEDMLDNVYLAGTRFDRISRLVMEADNGIRI